MAHRRKYRPKPWPMNSGSSPNCTSSTSPSARRSNSAKPAGTPPDQLSPEAVKGILVNPIYTGVGPFPRLVEDAAWVRACARLIDEEGADQFLVNLLHVLRECFREE